MAMLGGIPHLRHSHASNKNVLQRATLIGVQVDLLLLLEKVRWTEYPFNMANLTYRETTK
jgi:hypothetical protein